MFTLFDLCKFFITIIVFTFEPNKKNNAGFRILVFFFKKDERNYEQTKNGVFVFMWRNFARSHINFDVDDDYKWNG